MLYEAFGVVLAVQLNATVWGFPATHVPPRAALMTRCTTTTLHNPTPTILAVQVDIPMSIFAANWASATLTTPSMFRSQALIWIWAHAEVESKSRTVVRMKIRAAD